MSVTIMLFTLATCKFFATLKTVAQGTKTNISSFGKVHDSHPVYQILSKTLLFGNGCENGSEATFDEWNQVALLEFVTQLLNHDFERI